MQKNIKILTCSSYYETPSWPNSLFPKFLNIILKIKTNLPLEKLLINLKNIEKEIGRRPSLKNYPRLCDIDIIDYNGKSLSLNKSNLNITVPHSRMHTRNFVLFPLYEISPNWKHPKTNEKISILLSKLTMSSIRSIKII